MKFEIWRLEAKSYFVIDLSENSLSLISTLCSWSWSIFIKSDCPFWLHLWKGRVVRSSPKKDRALQSVFVKLDGYKNSRPLEGKFYYSNEPFPDLILLLARNNDKWEYDGPQKMNVIRLCDFVLFSQLVKLYRFICSFYVCLF